jgi:hypothetical protein
MENWLGFKSKSGAVGKAFRFRSPARVPSVRVMTLSPISPYSLAAGRDKLCGNLTKAGG